MIFALYIVVLLACCAACYLWGFGDGCFEAHRYVSGNLSFKRERGR